MEGHSGMLVSFGISMLDNKIHGCHGTIHIQPGLNAFMKTFMSHVGSCTDYVSENLGIQIRQAT
jgi:hypothetical protein